MSGQTNGDYKAMPLGNAEEPRAYHPAVWMELACVQWEKPDPTGDVLYEFNDVKFSNWSASPGLTGKRSVVAWILDSGEN